MNIYLYIQYVKLKNKEVIMNFKPLYDRVLVQRVESLEKTQGGILIPDSAQEKPMEGIIIDVGEGSIDAKNNSLRPLSVKKGDKVLFAKWGGTEVKIDGQEYMIMKESDILGKYI